MAAIRWPNRLNHLCFVSPLRQIRCQSSAALKETPENAKSPSEDQENGNIHRAIKIFLERQSKQKKFIEKERRDFENGRRHLANIMGWDVDAMTQDDVNKAIEYLFPSGLYALSARPQLKPPENFFPAEQMIPFDDLGRPLNHLFYTAHADYYQLMQKINLLTHKCQQAMAVEKSDAAGESSLNVNQERKSISMGASRWMERAELSEMLRGQVSEEQYSNFIAAFNYLVSLPYSYLYKEDIMKYRVSVGGSTDDDLITRRHRTYISKVLTCPETGRKYVQAEGKKKDTMIVLRCFTEGTGQFTIDGHELDYIPRVYRETCLAPLIVIDRLCEFDVDVRRETGEERAISSMAMAIRLALSRALIQLIEERDAKALRLAGYLTFDSRVRERQKPAQKGARAKWIWKKR